MLLQATFALIKSLEITPDTVSEINDRMVEGMTEHSSFMIKFSGDYKIASIIWYADDRHHVYQRTGRTYARVI